MYNILISLWLVVIILLLTAIARKLINRSSVYDFQNWEKSDMPFITIDIQGHPMNMITDSAASVSIIRKGVLEGLKYEESTRVANITAISDEGNIFHMVTIPITINGKEIKTDFAVYEGDNIANFDKYGITIDGILGVEFFKVSKGTIDFDKQSVLFP